MAAVKGLYRTMLTLAKRLPGEESGPALDSIRSSFKANMDVTDGEQLKELVLKAEKSLAYLRMAAPRKAGDGPIGGCYVVEGDRVVEGRAQAVGSAPHSTFGEGNVDPESLTRHNANMRRFHFGDRGVPPPAAPQMWD